MTQIILYLVLWLIKIIHVSLNFTINNNNCLSNNMNFAILQIASY